MQKRTLLVQLCSTLQPPNAEPLAIEVLANSIKNNGGDNYVDLEVINPELKIGMTRDELIEKLSHGTYALLGLSVPQGTLSLCCQILDRLSILRSDQKPLVILGHAIPTYAPEFFLEKYPWVILVRGWGEMSIVSIAKQLKLGLVDLKTIPGISFVQDGMIIHNAITNHIQSDPPLRLDIRKYFARIETSRGCTYGKCTFCTRPPGRRDSWRRLDIKQILNQINELSNENIRYFTFADEDFIGNDLDEARTIADRLKENGNLSFSISVRADNIYNPNSSDSENEQRIGIFESLRLAGLSRVFIGVESLSSTQLRRYGKGILLENSIKSVQIIENLNIPVEVGFILFDPLLTVDELAENTRNLRLTGMWQNAGMIFTKLRVQEASPYQQLLKKKGLLTSFDPNMISYEWEFADEKIRRAFSRCLEWTRDFQPSQKLLQNLERTKANHIIAMEYMHRIRHLDLLFLEVIANPLRDESQFSEKADLLRKERFELANDLKLVLYKQAFTNEEYILIGQLDNFLELHNAHKL